MLWSCRKNYKALIAAGVSASATKTQKETSF